MARWPGRTIGLLIQCGALWTATFLVHGLLRRLCTLMLLLKLGYIGGIDWILAE